MSLVGGPARVKVGAACYVTTVLSYNDNIVYQNNTEM